MILRSIFRQGFARPLLACWLGWLCFGVVKSAEVMETVRIGPDGLGFVLTDSGKPFRIWGVNYDRDDSAGGGRLLEDYWVEEWETVRHDFQEIRDLGANVVRIHLQLGKFMITPDRPNTETLSQLHKLLDLAGNNGLRLDLTGLGCYHRQDVPRWYDEMDEAARWEVQAHFWRAVAMTCRGHSAVFCYDLMNEPVTSGKQSDGWLAGELGGSYFIQRLTLHPDGRSAVEIVEAWVKKLTTAIRAEDPGHLITVGVIPWAMTWPEAKPDFYSPEAARHLDFTSIHVYPKAGEVDKALKALEVYKIGKPLLIEEMFPLNCSVKEMDEFVGKSSSSVSGWIGFYWGKTIGEYQAEKERKPSDTLTSGWLEYFREQAPSRRRQ
ncbi:MAG: cellulase family glycosylhydrolase [Luteolibacter sp.]|uniref:cellulase family glycosylhydrolase n=1 Tax=Luteolibacter sp. TaxID=1962973 RepID=UPI0032634B8F